MYEAFREMPGAVGEQNDDTRRMALLERFLKLKPPNFAGKQDPPTAEEWLKSVKKMFDTLNVPEIYRVGFATFLFERDAEAWWDLMEDDHDLQDMNWDQFEQFFQEYYVTGDYVFELISAFQDLVQGDMTVLEYQTKFIELSRYAPNLVADNLERCVKFREGLRQNIRSTVEPLPITTLRDLVTAAQRAEADLDANLGPDKGSRGKKNDGNRKINRKSGSGSSPGSGRNGPYCFSCGQQDHKKKNCPFRQQKRSLRSSKQSQGSQSGSGQGGTQSSQARPELSMIRRNKNQLKGSKVSGTTKGNSGSLGSGRFAPYSCHNCGQGGHFGRKCPYNRHQQSPLSSKGGVQRELD